MDANDVAIDPGAITADAGPVRRKPGRPPKQRDAGIVGNAAGDASGDSAGDDAGDKPRRGRKAKIAPVLNYGEVLCSIHAMLAIRLQFAPLAISQEQAAKLGEAINRVQRHYPISISAKTADWGFLAFALFETYAPIVTAAVAERKARAPKPAPAKPVPVETQTASLYPITG